MIQILGKYFFVVILFLAAVTSCKTRNMGKNPPGTGDRAPRFVAKDSNGNTWKLADHVGTKYLVIYFFTAALTSG